MPFAGGCHEWLPRAAASVKKGTTGVVVKAGLGCAATTSGRVRLER